MRNLLAVLTVASLTFAASSAQAGYLGVGLGSNATLTGEMAEFYSTGEQNSAGRIMMGQRVGPLALEASLFGTTLNSLVGEGEYSTVSLGVDLKYHFKLAGQLEGFGKIGVNRARVVARGDTGSMMDSSFSGTGNAIGAGLQYSLRLPVTQMAVWLDYTKQTFRMTGDGGSLAGGADMVTLGVTLGL